MTVCHRVSASVREITASGCRVFCKRATRGQLLPFLWNNKDGRPQSISLPENTALKIFGPDIRSCVWVCHCWTLCSKCQCQGGFHLWIPLEAHTPQNNTKDYQRTLASSLQHLWSDCVILGLWGVASWLLLGHCSRWAWEGSDPHRQRDGALLHTELQNLSLPLLTLHNFHPFQ